MTPIVTWVLVANTRNASVLDNRGPGKGLSRVEGASFQSEQADLPRDKVGVGHSIAGYKVSAVERRNPQAKIDAEFARELSDALSRARAAGKFDRLVVAAGPHMLGLLRAAFDESLRSVLVGELAKDLSSQSPEGVASRVQGFIAV